MVEHIKEIQYKFHFYQKFVFFYVTLAKYRFFYAKWCSHAKIVKNRKFGTSRSGFADYIFVMV